MASIGIGIGHMITLQSIGIVVSVTWLYRSFSTGSHAGGKA